MASARISPVCASRMTRPPAFALFCLDRGLQFAEREVLQARVDREREIAARLRRADRRDVLDDLAAAVDDHAAAARACRRATPAARARCPPGPTSRSPVKPTMWLSHLAARIVAAVLVLVVQALDAQRHRRARRPPARPACATNDEILARVELARERAAASSRGSRASCASFVRRRFDLVRETPRSTSPASRSRAARRSDRRCGRDARAPRARG